MFILLNIFILWTETDIPKCILNVLFADFDFQFKNVSLAIVLILISYNMPQKVHSLETYFKAMPL